MWVLNCSAHYLKLLTSNSPFTPYTATSHQEKWVFFFLLCTTFETPLVVFLEESVGCGIAVVGAEVGAETISVVGDGSA